jgi:hypothetical protein
MVRQAHHPEPGRRANSNDPNSKFKTKNPFTVVANCIIADRSGFVK